MDQKREEQIGGGPGGFPMEWMTSWAKKSATRRDFLKVGAGGMSTLALLLIGCGTKEQEELIEEVVKNPSAYQMIAVNAKGMVIAQPSRCVGCRRCELACTEFNDGKASPSLARIKVGRNYNFGPQGAQLGFDRGEGLFGNFRLIQETCRQCPHPVPCATACPYGAIEAVKPAYARVVNVDKCQGCRTCQDACPWGMTTFDEELNVASKCTLCDGDPECVKTCPASALQYVPWEDTTKIVPQRFVVPSYASWRSAAQESCVDPSCH